MICKHFYVFIFFNVRLLSVLGDHSVFSFPPQRPMTSDFEGFSIPYSIYYIYFPILILEKEPVFPFLMSSAKQENYWYDFYNVFGMTRSLTGDWTRDLPHSKPAFYYSAIIIRIFLILSRCGCFGVVVTTSLSLRTCIASDCYFARTPFYLLIGAVCHILSDAFELQVKIMN